MSQEPKVRYRVKYTRQAETCQAGCAGCLHGLSNGCCVYAEYAKALQALGVPCFIPIEVVNEPDFDFEDFL